MSKQKELIDQVINYSCSPKLSACPLSMRLVANGIHEEAVMLDLANSWPEQKKGRWWNFCSEGLSCQWTTVLLWMGTLGTCYTNWQVDKVRYMMVKDLVVGGAEKKADTKFPLPHSSTGWRTLAVCLSDHRWPTQGREKRERAREQVEHCQLFSSLVLQCFALLAHPPAWQFFFHPSQPSFNSKNGSNLELGCMLASNCPR